MLDNTLIALIISTILAGETTAGISGTPLLQAFQPTATGVNSIPTAYIHKISDRRVGSPYRSDVWDSINLVMTHTELQQYETVFQFSALARQFPSTPSAYTASDILNLIASILSSSIAIAAFEAQGVGIMRIMDIRNPYFDDDKGQNEANPSFDAIFSHKQIITSTTNIVATQIINVTEI